MAGAEEIVLAFPVAIPNLRNMRSTVLQGSVAAVRASEKWERYLAHLPADERTVLLESVAGTWIPIEVAAAHYEACDAAGFTAEQAYANGRKTFDVAGNVIFGTVLKMAKAAGVTPWTLLEQLQRFWDRGYDGGGLQVAKLGPKEARVHVKNVRVLESAYYRSALRGLLGAAVELFCAKVYVVERPGARPFGTVAYRVQWA